MKKPNSARALFGVMNLLAVSSPMLVSHASQAATTDQKIEKLNVASLKSIESTWLKVPNACKARGFNASPISLARKEAGARISDIYKAFGV